MEGWIKLHRKLLDWEWHDDSNVFSLFIHLILMANHKDKKWRGNMIKRGSLITSQLHLAKKVGISVRQVRTSLDKLKLTGELTVKTTNRYSYITINNYHQYQVNDRLVDKQMTGKRQTDDTQMTTNKNVKNDKNVKNKGFDNSWKGKGLKKTEDLFKNYGK